MYKKWSIKTLQPITLPTKKLQLQGIKDELQTYITLTDKKQKQIALESIDLNIVSGIPTFMSGDPGKGFSCFWGMAMLHISVRREMVDVFGTSGNQALLEQSMAIYSLFGATAQMVMFNERMDNVSFSCNSNNVPGKNSQWEVSAYLNDSITGALFQFAQRYFNASTSEITAGIQQCNNGVPESWNRLGDSVKAKENEWAGNIIQSFSKNCTIDNADRPALLSKYMGAALYSTYTSSYANQGYVVPPVQPWPNWYKP